MFRHEIRYLYRLVCIVYDVFLRRAEAKDPHDEANAEDRFRVSSLVACTHNDIPKGVFKKLIFGVAIEQLHVRTFIQRSAKFSQF
jgi:hypothetical protein